MPFAINRKYVFSNIRYLRSAAASVACGENEGNVAARP